MSNPVDIKIARINKKENRNNTRIKMQHIMSNGQRRFLQERQSKEMRMNGRSRAEIWQTTDEFNNVMQQD